MADDEAQILAVASKLPLAERVSHANWKVRSAAFEDIKKTCDSLFSDGDPVLDQYANHFPKAVTDSNAAALDKALDALVSFQLRATEQQASRIADRACSNIVAKCLTARPGTLQKIADVVLNFIELEQGVVVMESLVGGFAHKVPKAVVAAVELVYKALSAFGAKALPVAPLFKTLQPLFESKDSKVRDLAKQIVVELSRWLGAPVVRASLFDKMRDAIKEDVEKLMAGAPEGRPQATRTTRKEQARQQAAAEAAVEGGDAGCAAGAAAAEVEEEQADVFDIMAPKDILAELKKDFWEGLASAKWSERKGALSQLKELAAFPRLEPGDFGDVNREVKKVITKDSNVACVAEAISCTANLAQGLRREYAGAARTLCSILTDKFKEKNAAVGKAATEALTSMHKHCWDLLDVAEDVAAALGHQNPKVKEQTLQWLQEAISSRESKASIPKLAPVLLPAVAKCAEDGAPAIREAGMAVLVTFVVKVGNPAVLDKYTAKMDDAKRKKLEDMIGEARKTMGGRAAVPAPTAAPAAASSRPSTAASRPSSRAAPMQSEDTGEPAPSRTRAAAAAPSGQASRGAAARPPVHTAKPAAGASGAADVADDEVALSSGTMGRAEAVEKLTELLGEQAVAALQDGAWKARLEAMEALLERARADDSLKANGCVLVQAIQHVPGWDEKNFQVLSRQLDLVAMLAQECPSFGKREGLVAINGCIEKLSDIKLKGPANGALMATAEALGPQFLANLIHKKAAGHKNPKVFGEAINTISQTITEFGLQALNVKTLLDWMKEDLGSTTPVVRNAAVQLLGVMHRFVGPGLADMIRNDIKPALMTTVEAEFDKNPRQASFTPARVSRAAARGSGAGGAPAGKAAAGGTKGGKAGAAATATAAYDTDDLLPREDISGSITSKLISNLGSSNWKERKAAMDEVEQALAAAGNRIQPNTGDLLHSLKPRMADANRNLTVQALQLVGKLAKAMGRPIAREGRGILGPSVKNLSDPKTQVRAAVVEMLITWASVAPADVLFAEVAEVLAAPKCSNDGKKEGLAWVSDMVREGKGADCLPDAVRCAAVCSQDKAVDVREASTALLNTLLEVYGAGEVGAAAQQLEGPARKAALEFVTKLTGSAPAAGPGPAASVRSSLSTAPASRASLLRTSTSSSLKTAPASKLATTGAASSAKTAAVRSSSSIISRSASSAGAAPGAAGGDGPLLSLDLRKDERAKKGKYKGTKFELRPEEAQELDHLFAPITSAGLRALLFGKDFKRHCEGADLLRESAGAYAGEVLACVDLIFRWCVLRISEGNTQTLIKILDLLKVVLDLLAGQAYKMSEYEAKLLLPGLVEKCGQSQDKLKADFRELMRRCCSLMPASKVLAYVRDGLDSKNNRTRVACAEEIASIVEREGAKVYGGGKHTELWPAVAKLTSERDGALRGAALGALEVLYAFEGEGAMALLGRLTDQQRSIVEERFKACDKDLARKGLRAGYRGAEAAAAAGPPSPLQGPARPATAAATMTRPAASAAARVSGSGSARGEASVPTSLNPLMQPLGGPSVAAAAAHLQRPMTAPVAASQSFAAMANTPPTQPMAPALQSLQTSAPVQLAIRKDSQQTVEEDFRRIIARLQGDDPLEAVEVMKLICYEVAETKPPHPLVMDALMYIADDLLRTLAYRAELVFSSAADGVKHQLDTPVHQRACKYSLNTLMALCNLRPITQCLGQATLHVLVGTLLRILIDGSVPNMSQGQAMLTAINVLMLRILENSNKNCAFGSLLQHLIVCPGQVSSNGDEGVEGRWFDLVVKCLIKVTKTLPQSLGGINVPELLLSIHHFFEALGPEEVSRRHNTDDKPYRMVKTILHEVVKHCGPDTIRMVPEQVHQKALGKPVIVVYIENYLHTHSAMRGGAPAVGYSSQQLQPAAAQALAGHSRGAAPGALSRFSNATLNTSASSLPDADEAAPAAAQLSSAAGGQQQQQQAPLGDDAMERHTLASLFKRIGDKAEAEQAMRDLHDFTSRNPHINIDSYLVASSAAFKTYIHKGLMKISGRMQQQQQQQPWAAEAAAAAPSSIAAVRPQHAAAPMDIDEGQAEQEGAGTSAYSRAHLDSMRERMRSSAAAGQEGSAAAAPRTAELSSDFASLQERFKRLQVQKGGGAGQLEAREC